ncbi:phosphoglycerate dehydrogenase [bacterium]|nr:phosphoglycerate dehydrogenase [bacterium]
MKILVSDPLSETGMAFLNSQKGFEVVVKTGLSEEALCKEIRGYDALLVRSGTTVTAKVIEAADSLRLIGRAGVGVDNVDVQAATKRGIIVMNTPDGNTISTAEHSFAMLLALSRNIPQAVSSMRKGEWDRKSFKGVELHGKILGVIGMGRIGTEVAKRARAFNMVVYAYDPFLSEEMAKKFGVELAGKEKIFKEADFITVHTPLTDDTRDLINNKSITLMKKGVRIINCARGGIVNENDLLAALESGKIAGAALDVFETEPPSNPALIAHPKLIATPHLGASTTEAQEKVAIDVAKQVVDALHHGIINNAVNAPSADSELLKVLKPYIVLSEKLGKFLSAIASGRMQKINILFGGKAAKNDVSLPSAAFVEGVLKKAFPEQVNIVNAVHLATERGIRVEQAKSDTVRDYADYISASVETNEGTFSVSGTFFSNRNEPRIIDVNGYYINAQPYGTLLYVINKDLPGIIGEMGVLLGKHGINIADMTVGRHRPGDIALTLINLDQPVSDNVLTELRSLEKIIEAKQIIL